MASPYTIGTVTVTAGSKIVTGVGTNWEAAGFLPGLFGATGFAVPVATVDSDTQLTLEFAWPGESGSALIYWYADWKSQQSTYNAQRLAEYIARLNNPALAAAAGVTPAANKILLFTGANTATLVDLNDLIQGVKFDAEVPTLADRAAYDTQPKDFKVAVANIGNGRSAFYTKLSNASGDWSVPFYLSGPVGGAGPYTEITVGTTTTLPAGSSATVTPVVVDADTIRLDFGLPKGQDGSGTGDVVGPASSVNSRIAEFSGTTGKLLKDGGVAISAFLKTVLDDADGASMFATMGAVKSGTNTNGTLRFPNGWMINFGYTSGDTTVVFATAFPNALLTHGANSVATPTAPNEMQAINASAVGANGITFRPRYVVGTAQGVASQPYNWFAIGY